MKSHGVTKSLQKMARSALKAARKARKAPPPPPSWDSRKAAIRAYLEDDACGWGVPQGHRI